MPLTKPPACEAGASPRCSVSLVQIMATSFGVVTTKGTCPDCTQTTELSGLIVFDFRMRRGRDAEWCDHPVAGLLSHIGKINGGANRIWSALVPSIRPATFSTGGSYYYTNSCRHCNQPIGDVPLRKPSAALNPLDRKSEDELKLQWIEAAIIVDCRVMVEGWMDSLIARRHPWA